MGSVDQAIVDALIAQQIYLLRFSASERAAVLQILTNMQIELLERLHFKGRTMSEASRADIIGLLKECQDVIAEYYSHVTDAALSGLSGLGRVEAEATAGAISAAFAAQIVPALPTETYFKVLVKNTLIEGAPSANWWAGQQRNTSERFANAVRQGLAASETNAQIIQRIRRDVMPIARNNAAALVQTSVAAVAAEARMETYRQNTDIMAGFRQVSTLDSHTTLICVSYSGKEWDLERKPVGHNLPFVSPKGSATGCPRHFNCRSIMAPRTKTFKELGLDVPESRASTKAASGGPISSKLSFDDYLKRKGPAFTDELLGKGRADLWRSGTISLSQLLDQSGRPLTLAQLRAKYL